MRWAAYLHLPLVVALSVVVVVQAYEAERLYDTAVAMQSPRAATEQAVARVLERLSFEWYHGASDHDRAYHEVIQRADLHQRRAMQASVAALLLCGVHGLVLWRQRAGRRNRYGHHLSLWSWPALATGISAPLLSVTVHGEVPVIGRVILSHDYKSILSTAGGLWHSQQWFLAVLVAAFSILLPTLKLGLLSGHFFARAANTRTRLANVLHHLGRWSMTDVFVVAVLVAFLAFDADRFSTARVGVGLFWFAGYCALSLAASHCITRATADGAQRPT